jgi:hypothetical protein
MQRGTLSCGVADLHRLISRLADAVAVLTGPDGPRVIEAALRRARQAADIDTILAHCRY